MGSLSVRPHSPLTHKQTRGSIPVMFISSTLSHQKMFKLQMRSAAHCFVSFLPIPIKTKPEPGRRVTSHRVNLQLSGTLSTTPPLQTVPLPSCAPSSSIFVLANGLVSSPHTWSSVRCFSLYFSLHILAKLPASARRTRETCSSKTDRCREAPCGC